MKNISLVLSLTCLFFFTSAQDIHIWNGETGNDPLCNLNDYFEYNYSEAYSGSTCLEGKFDPWHAAQLNLLICSYYRQNIAFTQELCFYIKANATDEKITISLAAWHSDNNGLSPEVELAPFIQDGNVTETYKQVCIPLEEFRDGVFTALWIEAINFRAPNATTDFRIYVDDIILNDTVPIEVNKLETIANNTIKLHFDGRYDIHSIDNPANFMLSSTEDPLFSSPIMPSEIGVQYYYDGLESDTTWIALPKSQFTLFLIFDEAMRDQLDYTLTLQDVQDAAGNLSQNSTIDFTYQENIVNGTVKVNQVGYLPQSLKYAYVGNYTGTAGMLDINPSTFEIRNAQDDQIEFSGPTNFRGEDDLLSGEKVYECDFTNFKDDGTFYIFVEGLGRSYDFVIGPDVYNNTFHVAAKGLYFSRCGTALDTQYAGVYARPICHQNDCLIHSSILNAETYGNEIVDAPYEVGGGWHDAGDYSRPLSNQVVVISELLEAFDAFPEKFADDWNIPGSGNQIPDILDEAKWGLDFLLKMQSEDGGAFFKIAPKDYPRKMPQNDDAQYYLSAKTTYITAMYAAVMAKAARIYAYCLPDFADDCLSHAELAWQFLENNPDAEPSFGYIDDQLGSDLSCGQAPDDLGDYDERAWAAAELYHTTGQSNYHDAFVTNWEMNDAFFGWNESVHSQKRASLAYQNIKGFPVDPNIKETILSAVIFDANKLKDFTLLNLYRGAYRSDYRPYIGWGDYNQSTTDAATFLKAFFLTGDSTYLDAAKLNIDPQLGNNPLSRSFITGVGENPIMNPIHYPSELDGIEDPIPGIPVFGVHHNEEYQYRTLIDSFITYPHFYDPSIQQSVYPTLRRHFDQQRVFSMNEFTIAENMQHLIFTLAYFSNINVTTDLCEATSTENKLEESSITVFPNPTNNQITISLNAGDYQIRIFNTNGQLVEELDINRSFDYDLSHFSAAMFFIEIRNNQNQKVYWKKIMKF